MPNFKSPIESSHALPELPALQFSNAANLGVPEYRANVEALIDGYIDKGVSVRDTLTFRSDTVDEVLIQLYKHFELDQHTKENNKIALFAVGGYGRQQMLPFSDVDIMILTEVALSGELVEKVQAFVTKLWDIGLDAGVSVRSLGDCIAEIADITVATSLLESRLLIGDDSLAKSPKQIIRQEWTDRAFYEAKIEEQKTRYRKHNTTEYNLEPDIKNAPGGLRDVHHIGWICKRHFRINSMSDMVQQNFVTDAEYEELIAAEDFLLTMRHHLHRIVGRGENKLLFDYQRQVAEHMGYNDKLPSNAHHNAAIEALMRVYYRKAMRISTLNEMLNAYYLETFIEPKLSDEEKPQEIIINDEFTIINNAIAVRHSKVFTKNPNALLELFVLMGRENVKDVRAKTLRLLKAQANLIDKDFRQDPKNKALFMSIMANPNYLFQILRKMKRFGVLGRYLPAFEKVTGLMQYDLFHRYTVDAHTLLLFRILHRLNDPKYTDTFATVGGVYDHLERKDLIHLAALFHDIAKGRGGDHSELGAEDAYDFCKLHGLSNHDANLVAWLVHHHLLMSVTAQKRDISDPDIIHQFAEKIGDMVHLNYLYVLTVVDMNATNPELWNSWRASLMQQLYKSTRAMMKAGLDLPLDKETLITKTKEKALSLLNDEDDIASIEAIWEELGDEYFLRETAQDIVWHSRAILAHGDSSEPLVVLQEHHEISLDAIQVFIYVQDMPNLFANTVSIFNEMDLDVQDARIITATRDFALDSYVLIDRHGTLLNDDMRANMLIEKLTHTLSTMQPPKIVHKRMPRQLKHFDVPTNITFQENKQNGFHDLVIETLDQPGLLAIISCVFLKHDIEVHSARITTLGERAQDIFTISDHEDNKLPTEEITSLIAELTQMLDDPENVPAECG